ncbi:hypothetical protein [Dactylosporangium maewongense]
MRAEPARVFAEPTFEAPQIFSAHPPTRHQLRRRRPGRWLR